MDLASNESLLSIALSPNETLLSMDLASNETLLSMDLAPSSRTVGYTDKSWVDKKGRGSVGPGGQLKTKGPIH